jgi:hypothetical protein
MIAHSDLAVRKAKIIPQGYSAGKWKGKELTSESIGTQTAYYLYPVEFFPRVWETATNLSRRLDADIDRLVADLYGGMSLPARPFSITFDDGL